MADDRGIESGWSFRRWPMSVKVVASLTCALLPLGALATYVTASAYRQTIAHAGHVSAQRWAALAIPLAMWLSALLIGWLIANELLVKPCAGWPPPSTANAAATRARGSARSTG